MEREAGSLRECELAALQRGLARDGSEQRRLAGAVRPCEREAIAPVHGERDAGEQWVARELLPELACDQNCHGRNGTRVLTADGCPFDIRDAKPVMITPMRIACVVSAALALVLISTAAGSIEQQGWRGVPSKRGVYSACYLKSNGSLRVVPAFRRCRVNEFRMTWAKRGPAGSRGATGEAGAQGPQGPRGPQGTEGMQGQAGATGATGPPGPTGAPGGPGPQGPTGAAGPAGPSGSTRVAGNPATSAANAARNTAVTATASCAAGKVLLGGGARITTTATQKERAYLQTSFPSSTTTWTAIGVVGVAALGAGNTMTVTAYALCSL